MLVIDFHAHILPGADHGSDSVKTSLAQLALMRTAGTEAAVATPHFFPDRDNIDSFFYRRAAAAERLLAARRPLLPTLYLGAEVAVCPHLEQMGREALGKLCVAGTDVILLEMPTAAWTEKHVDAVFGIRELGFHVILAHIDRYPAREAEKLMSSGFEVQLNASAFSGLLGRARYTKLAKTNTVVALGSDLHGAEPRAYRAFAGLGRKIENIGAIFARTSALLAGAVPLAVGEPTAIP